MALVGTAPAPTTPPHEDDLDRLPWEKKPKPTTE
jgi:hypothetical protein